MFEKRKAILLYKKLLSELAKYNEIMQKNPEYKGIDKGFEILPSASVNDKVIEYLENFVKNDGLNFKVYNILDDKKESTLKMFVISNESLKTLKKEKSKIIDINNYRRRKNSTKN